MKNTVIIYILIILSIPLYAQEDTHPKQWANKIGLPIICDSAWSPFDKSITIIDSTYGGIRGWCFFEILTKEDGICIEKVKFYSFSERGEIEHNSTLFENCTFVECVQEAIQNKLFHGYIVYPDHGEWSKPLTRHGGAVRIVIEEPSQIPKTYSNEE